MKFLSSDKQFINATCENCGEIIRIDRSMCTKSKMLYQVFPAYNCDCGAVSDIIRLDETSEIVSASAQQIERLPVRCNRCDAPIPYGSEVCEYCGGIMYSSRAVNEPFPSSSFKKPSQVSVETNVSKQTNQSASKASTGIIILAIIWISFVTAIGFFVLNGAWDNGLCVSIVVILWFVLVIKGLKPIIGLMSGTPSVTNQPITSNPDLSKTNSISSSNQNIPRCPTCGSTKIHKISAENKIGSVALFGIFAVGHVSKTFKCDNCGAKW